MKLIIYGCGGHARSIINTIIENGGRPDILIVDDNAKLNEKIMGVSVVRDYILQKDNKYIVAVGNNEERKGIYDKLKYWPDGECSQAPLAATAAPCKDHLPHGQTPHHPATW